MKFVHTSAWVGSCHQSSGGYRGTYWCVVGYKRRTLRLKR